MKRKVTRNETDSKKELNDAIRKKRMESWRQRAFDSSLLLTLYFTYSILSSFPHLSHPVAQCNPLHFVFLYHTMRHRITAETNSSAHIHTHAHTHTHIHTHTPTLTHSPTRLHMRTYWWLTALNSTSHLTSNHAMPIYASGKANPENPVKMVRSRFTALVYKVRTVLTVHHTTQHSTTLHYLRLHFHHWPYLLVYRSIYLSIYLSCIYYAFLSIMRYISLCYD